MKRRVKIRSIIEDGKILPTSSVIPFLESFKNESPLGNFDFSIVKTLYFGETMYLRIKCKNKKIFENLKNYLLINCGKYYMFDFEVSLFDWGI